MTINELNEILKKIDYRFCAEQYCGVPAKIVFNGGDIYYFHLHKFAFDGLANVLNSKDIDKSKWYELQDIIIDYFKLKENQAISKEKNGSTMPFEDDISNDYQKKTKEQLIYDFVDEIADHNFKATQTMTLHKTSSISIKADEVGTPCLNIYLTGILDDRIPENPIQIKADDINEKSSSQLGWLLNRASKLVSDLRSM